MSTTTPAPVYCIEIATTDFETTRLAVEGGADQLNSAPLFQKGA